MFGLPWPRMEAVAQEVAFGGCEIFGDDRDPTFHCLDCTYSNRAEADEALLGTHAFD